jgi:hypothetical protein
MHSRDTADGAAGRSVWESGHHVARVSKAVVSSMYEAAGTSALYVGCPIERAHRDIHAVMQHVVFATALAGGRRAGQARPHTTESRLLEPIKQNSTSIIPFAPTQSSAERNTSKGARSDSEFRSAVLRTALETSFKVVCR